MSGGIIPSREFNEQLKRTVRERLRRVYGTGLPRGKWHKKGKGGGSPCSDCCQKGVATLVHPGTSLNTVRAWEMARKTCSGLQDLSLIKRLITGGSVEYPGGRPVMVWDAIRSLWVADVADVIIVRDNGGVDVTGTATITTAEFVMDVVDPGLHSVVFNVTVTI